MPNNHLELHYIVYKWKYKKLFSIICTVFRNKLSWSLFLQAARMSLHKYGLGFLQLSINNKWIELILFWYENVLVWTCFDMKMMMMVALNRKAIILWPVCCEPLYLPLSATGSQQLKASAVFSICLNIINCATLRV